ncbi:hypothetical protein RRG08_042723 [Elysia crispata]|uniref:Uncharacterized protein n=1 Tax=Elysia crispata TaxID=231223 RepID=A0AAE0XR14_9GAST|nr:hypothetical protein RRG08_042723 [Elysia crispata]
MRTVKQQRQQWKSPALYNDNSMAERTETNKQGLVRQSLTAVTQPGRFKSPPDHQRHAEYSRSRPRTPATATYHSRSGACVSK